MTAAEFRNMLALLAEAWSKRDYEEALSLFAEDVYYADPLRYEFKNRGELRKFFNADEGYDQKTEWHMVVFDEQQQAGAAEYTYMGTHLYHGVALISLKDGLIKRWLEYQHIDKR